MGLAVQGGLQGAPGGLCSKCVHLCLSGGEGVLSHSVLRFVMNKD